MALTWSEVRAIVADLGVDPADLVLAGSVPLVAHGIVPTVGDIDVVALAPAWQALASRGATPRTGDHGDLVLDLGDAQVFSGWHGTRADAVAARAGLVDGLRVASLTDVIAYKRALGRPKDVEHLVALKRWVDDMSETIATQPRAAVPFADRAHAGEMLAPIVAALEPVNPLVLALPRGGVPVAAPVARALGCDLDVLVVRKLGVPSNPEYGFGALGEGAAPLINERVVAAAGLLESEVAQVIQAETVELARRVALYRAGRPALDLTGRHAVIVDDGSATGATARAAVAVARAVGAAAVTVAVGACPPDVLELLSRSADRAVAALRPEPFLSVGQWYRDFAQTTDEEVLATLQASP
ncbi:phosphoribosyltransferase [uncultured Demequina sp.]|uniref:phosphoribosyltransferase n=1 Tax=uncultured Demequina sp. TaxID=693499 RepID=UPI0025EC1CBF|nr:phosphoribosyltransferase family protein [uncultured Demequina sp.]